MSKNFWVSLIVIASVIFSCDLYGQGRGGRGQGGRGGGGRHPSMSRSQGGGQRQMSRPQRGGQRNLQRGQPQSRQRGDRGGRRGQVQQPSRPGAPQRNPDRGQGGRDLRERFRDEGARDRAQQRRSERPRQDRREQRRDPEARQERVGDRRDRRKETGSEIRENVRNHHSNYHHWFKDDFWKHHHYHPRYPYYGRYWRPLTWAAIASWYPWASNRYYYYDSGYAYYPESSGEYEYVETNPFDYEESGEEISGRPKSESSSESDWLPVGVFALTSASNTAAPPNMYLQLALDKQGGVEGTFYNSTSDQLYPLEGYVDEKTQRVVLQVSGAQNSPILETGLYNLTEEQTTVQMHFANGQTQDWLLVRLEDEN